MVRQDKGANFAAIVPVWQAVHLVVTMILRWGGVSRSELLAQLAGPRSGWGPDTAAGAMRATGSPRRPGQDRGSAQCGLDSPDDGHFSCRWQLDGPEPGQEAAEVRRSISKRCTH